MALGKLPYSDLKSYNSFFGVNGNYLFGAAMGFKKIRRSSWIVVSPLCMCLSDKRNDSDFIRYALAPMSSFIIVTSSRTRRSLVDQNSRLTRLA